MVGDSSDKIWGVMDVYPRTDFPDIRRKSIIKSAAGSLLLIPREGDAMVRFYMELPAKHASEVSLQDLRERAQLIFRPYHMEFAHVAWWSAYSIGQRVADGFTKHSRAFLAGDACHTHSPKAGQGMNVSLQDGYNIGWKLAAVLRGYAVSELLDTYVSERSMTAKDLIEFDRFISNLFSSQYREQHGITMEGFGEAMKKAGRVAACLAVHYHESLVTSGSQDDLLNIFIDHEGYSGGHGHAYDAYGINGETGAVVVVRPDQYVSTVCAVEEIEKLGDYFSGFLKEQQ
ncbi:hypothetical protein K4F52_003318 [Lecanicillium sp. MT-2017a]|nr:hypothetical protein K4F52_003318 [Lecanicillium sp. MT-2017a]